jgi:transcriptional regulator with XRE-family HTH domain
MSKTTYITQPWFDLLVSANRTLSRIKMAELLGVSAPQLSQVLNVSGKYGSGEASTAKLAAKVLHVFGRYECPHLTAQQGTSIELSAAQCRAYAHRTAPTGSPRDMQHWQACNACPHKTHTVPPQPRTVVPRGPKGAAADGVFSTPSTDSTDSPTPKETPHDFV